MKRRANQIKHCQENAEREVYGPIHGTSRTILEGMGLSVDDRIYSRLSDREILVAQGHVLSHLCTCLENIYCALEIGRLNLDAERIKRNSDLIDKLAEDMLISEDNERELARIKRETKKNDKQTPK